MNAEKNTKGRTSYADLRGVGRALTVLELLAERPMRAKEVAAATGTKWTTAYRTLTYLREMGYLHRDESTNVYYIGSRLYYIGSSYLANLPILQAARPYLKAASDETGAVAQLVERDRDRTINLLVYEPQDDFIPKTTIAFHFPLHCGAKGQVLLAYSTAEELEAYLATPLVSLTPHTTSDPDELRVQVEWIREHGYAVTRRDVQLSTAAVAAPIRSAKDEVVASITLIADAAAFDEMEPRLVDVVLNAARSISLAIGWRPSYNLSRT